MTDGGAVVYTVVSVAVGMREVMVEAIVVGRRTVETEGVPDMYTVVRRVT